MDFYVYKLEFEKSKQTNLLAGDTKVDKEFIRQKWGECFQFGSIKLAKEKAGQSVPVYAPVKAYHDDVAVLMVHNLRTVKQWDKLAEEPNLLDSFPHCYAIVDNRVHSPQILIENNEAFGTNPHKAMQMFCKYANRFLLEYGYEIKLYYKYRLGDIYKCVDENEKAGKFVKSVKFVLRHPEQMDKTGDQSVQDTLNRYKYLNVIQREYGSAITEIRHKAKNNEHGLQLSREIGSDFYNLVRLSGQNGYNLEIEFFGAQKFVRHAGTTKETGALYTITIGILPDFIQEQQVLYRTNNLLTWLDEIRKEDSASKYAEKPIQ